MIVTDRTHARPANDGRKLSFQAYSNSLGGGTENVATIKKDDTTRVSQTRCCHPWRQWQEELQKPVVMMRWTYASGPNQEQ
jgi:hypothetical protein